MSEPFFKPSIIISPQGPQKVITYSRPGQPSQAPFSLSQPYLTLYLFSCPHLAYKIQLTKNVHI